MEWAQISRILKHPAGRFFIFLSIVVLATIAAYSNTLQAPFIFDDLTQILENDHIQRLWPISETLAGTSRPVAYFTFSLNYRFGGFDVRGYHAVNLLIHLLAALTLFGIVRRTIRQRLFAGRYRREATTTAFFVALLWALHPLQTESVTCAIHRTESLMGLFYLLTLYSVIRGAGSRSGRSWYFASVLFCFLGMGTKEVMATAPIVILIYDRVFLASSWQEVFRKRKYVYFCFVLCWGWLAYLVTQQPQKTQTTIGFHLQDVTVFQYALTQTQAIVRYLQLSFLPAGLCVDYGWPFAKSLTEVAGPAVVVLVLIALTLWFLKRTPPLGFLGFWFFLVLAPTSSFLPILDAVAERRMYLALAAVVMLFVLGVQGFSRFLIDRFGTHFQYGSTRLSAVLVLTCAAILGFLTYQRNQDYLTRVSIWEDVIKKRPQNARALNNLARELLDLGQYEEAYQYAGKALDINPDYAAVHNNLANALRQLQQYEKAEFHYREAFRLDPEIYVAYYNYGILLLSLKRNEEALRSFEKSMEINPDFTRRVMELGHLYAKRNEFDSAKTVFRAVVRQNPSDGRAQFALANVYARDGKQVEAISHYEAAIRTDPTFVEAYNNLGMMLLQQGKTEEAIEQLSKTVELAPDDAAAFRNLAAAYFRKGLLDRSSFYLARAREIEARQKNHVL